MVKLFLVTLIVSLITIGSYFVGAKDPRGRDIESHDDLGLANRTDVRQDRMSVASFTKLESKLKSKIRCGRPIKANSRSPRIVDGKPATIDEFPWMVSLQREKSFWFGFKAFHHTCGASLITPSWLVSAAHCVHDKDNALRAVAGTDDLNFLYRAQMRTVEKIVEHPGFDSESFDNDISLLKVSRPFELESTFSHVAPVCFERDVPVEAYDIASVCGFGSKAYESKTRTHLYKTDIAIIDQKTCNKSFDGDITNNMICAGGMISHKRDACSGDSGGPLVLENNGHLSLIGAVSFGNSCATKGYPGIYTRLNNYYDWVLQHIDEKLFDP